jgi:hypothetical protein
LIREVSDRKVPSLIVAKDERKRLLIECLQSFERENWMRGPLKSHLESSTRYKSRPLGAWPLGEHVAQREWPQTWPATRSTVSKPQSSTSGTTETCHVKTRSAEQALLHAAHQAASNRKSDRN